MEKERKWKVLAFIGVILVTFHCMMKFVLCAEKKAHRIGSDLRPVFPEERLLLEIMIGEPFKYKNSSVWNAAGNYYYVDGKKLTFSVKQTKLLNAKMIRKQLDELSDQNSYDFFDKNIGKEVVKEFLLNPNAMYLEAEEIYKKYQK